MLRYIQKFTEEEAWGKYQNLYWFFSVDELDAFISLMYARGVWATKLISLLRFWSNSWEQILIAETTTRDRFLNIMEYLHFYMKFHQIPETAKWSICPSFRCFEFIYRKRHPGENITVGKQLFLMKTRCRFIRYMPQNTYKLGI